MFGDFLSCCENHHFLIQTSEGYFFGATFGKTYATFYLNIWSHFYMTFAAARVQHRFESLQGSKITLSEEIRMKASEWIRRKWICFDRWQ